MSKNIAVYFNAPIWSNRHPEFLEILWSNSLDGHNLFYISCQGELSSCPANPYHRTYLCVGCRLQNHHLVKHLLPEKAKFVTYSRSLKKLNLDSQLPTTWRSLLDYVYGTLPIGKLVASQLADNCNDIEVSPREIIEKAPILIESGIDLYEWTKKFIVEEKIDCFYTWNGRRPSDGPTVYAAIDTGVDFKVYISSKPGTYFAEKIISAQERSSPELKAKQTSLIDQRIAAEKYFEDLERNKLLRNFHLRNTHQFSKPINGKPLLSIFTSTMSEFVGRTQMEILFTQYKVIESICNDSDLKSKFNLLVRFHPLSSLTGKFENNLIRHTINTYPGIQFFAPKSRQSSYNIVNNSDLVLVFGSTIGIEACWRGKPTLLFGKSKYDSAKFVYKFNTFDKLKTALMVSHFDSPTKESVAQYLVELDRDTKFTFVERSRLGPKLKNKHIERFVLFQFVLRKSNEIAKRIFYFLKIFK